MAKPFLVQRLEPRMLFAFTAPYISEFMASNTRTLADADGQYNDWVEIHNPTGAAVDLGGWYLTDSAADLTNWRIPNGTTLPANGRRVIFASDKNRTNPAGQLHTDFKLGADGEYLALVRPDGATVAHAYAPKYPNQLDDVSYGIFNDVEQYFTTPTPGSANTVGAAGVVADTSFSRDRGFYDAPVDVAITTATPGATIRYTTNGDNPTATTGTVYNGPITINKTTTLRAAAFKPGFVLSDIDTQTYVFVNDVVNQTAAWTTTPSASGGAGFPTSWGSTTPDYGMGPNVVNDPAYGATIRDDLRAIPTLSIVMPTDDMFGSNGIYTNSGNRGDDWERQTSIELINPDGTPGFQVNAGIQIQGGAFRFDFFTKKHSFKVLFKDKWGPPKLDFPIFGANAADSFNSLVLRANANDGWSWRDAGDRPLYARDEWARRTQLDMGQVAPHGTFTHLYINGVYWGLYNPVEEPDSSLASTYYSGSPDDWDVRDQSAATDGDLNAWNTMLSLADAVKNATNETDRKAAYQRIQGNRPDGTDDPALQDYLDVDNLIDYMIVNLYAGNNDWPWNNWRAARLRTDTGIGTEDTGYKFFVWDAEWSMWGPEEVGNNRTGVTEGPAQIYDRLRSSPEFRLRFADRARKALADGGPLAVDASNPNWDPAHPERNRPAARMEEVLNEIRQPIVAESARWGDQHNVPHTKQDWLNAESQLLGGYFPQRTSVFISQLAGAGLYGGPSAPAFSKPGGQIAAGFNLLMSGPAGTVYYTLNGTDPRAADGTVYGGASAFQSAATVALASGTTKVMARTRDASGNWSALNEAVFFTAAPATAANLRITEINYHPYDQVPASGETFTNADDYEFVELANTSAGPISLSGLQFTYGIRMDFPYDSILAPGERVVVVGNEAAFRQRYGNGPRVLGQYADNLDNAGERLILEDAAGDLVHSFNYDDEDAWPATPDGQGPTLEVIDTAGDYDAPSNWRASGSTGGSPGLPPAVGVAAFAVNAGAAQRSAVKSLTVTFDRAVTLGAGAFALAGRNGAGAGATVSWSNPSGNGRVFELTIGGTGLAGGSLADGVYDLTVLASAVTGANGGAAMSADRAFAFHRLYGDDDGDGDVDAADLFQLRSTVNKRSTDAGYKYWFDYDGGGVVDAADLFQLRSRVTKTFKGY